MTAAMPKFSLLLDLAKEPSSDKRRDLLHQITDIFISSPGQISSASYAALDELAVAVLSDVTSEVRSDLAHTFMESALPLRRTARQLAMTDIEVARPVIEHWAALSDADLLEIVATKSQEHLMAVTRRADIAEPISDALVAHGEDQVVASLLANNSARIGQPTFDKVLARARTSPVLHVPVARRQDVPLSVMSALYNCFSVELRKEVLKRYESIAPEALNVALERSWTRVEKMYNALPDDFEAAQRKLKQLENAGELKPALLARLAGEGAGARTLFVLAFGRLTDESYHVIFRLLEARDLDAIALLCRAAGFSRALFMTLIPSVVKTGCDAAMTESCGFIYEKVVVASAQRAVRFWKLRALV